MLILTYQVDLYGFDPWKDSMSGVHARRYHYWDADEPVCVLVADLIPDCSSPASNGHQQPISLTIPCALHVAHLQREGAHSYELTYYAYTLLELSKDHSVR